MFKPLYEYKDKDNLFCRHTGKRLFRQAFNKDIYIQTPRLNDSSQEIYLQLSSLSICDLKAYAPEIISLVFYKYKSEINRKNAEANTIKENTAKSSAWDGIVN